MESKTLVICDPEEQYAQSLAFYILNRRELHLQVHVFTSVLPAREVMALKRKGHGTAMALRPFA